MAIEDSCSELVIYMLYPSVCQQKSEARSNLLQEMSGGEVNIPFGGRLNQ